MLVSSYNMGVVILTRIAIFNNNCFAYNETQCHPVKYQ